MKNYSYLILSLLLNISYVYAQLGSVVARNLKCSNDGTVVLYVAGQENTLPNIEESRVRLQYLFRKVYKNQDGSNLLDKPRNPEPITKLEFQALKNETLGLVGELAIGDFAKSIALIFQSEYKLSREASWKLAYQYFAHALSLKLINNGKEITISPEISRLMANKHKTLLQQLIEVDEHITNDLKSMILAGSEKQKLILVSHSQGNLFVNTAVQELNSDSTFTKRLPFIGNVQVASPSQYVGVNKNLHVTNSMDAILRLDNFFYTPLSSNFLLIRPLPDYRDLLDQEQNHGFLTTYLRGQEHGDFFIDSENGNLGQLKELVVQSIVDVAAKLDSNCADEFIPPIEYSADFGPGSTIPVSIDAMDTVKTLELRHRSELLNIEWNVGAIGINSPVSTITQYFRVGISHPGTAKINLKNGNSILMKFDIDLTSYIGGMIPIAAIEQRPDEWINHTAMDLGWNHLYITTTLNRLITLNPDDGQKIREQVIPENVFWMNTNKSGKIVILHTGLGGKMNFALKDPISGQNSLNVELNVDIPTILDPAFDKKNNILYFSISDRPFILDPADGIFKQFVTLVAVNGETGAELSRADYLSYSMQEEVFRYANLPTFVNSNGWLVRMGNYAYNPMDGSHPVLMALSAAWNPRTQRIDFVNYPDYFFTAGFVAMDNRKNLGYAYMNITDFNGPTRFTAIDSNTRGIVYSQTPDTVPNLTSPQITSKGHMIGLVQTCTTTCTYSLNRLLRSDDVPDSY